MKITAIKSSTRQQGRYLVYAAGEYVCSLSATALLQAKIVADQEITEDGLDELRRLSHSDKIYAQALKYAAMRPRSTWEMQTYLERKEASPPLCVYILNKLSELKIVSDETFARSWIADRRLLKSASRLRLANELRQKHISPEVIERALAEDATDDLAVLRGLVERKRRQPRYKDDSKLTQYLARQGYRYEDIRNVLRGARETT